MNQYIQTEIAKSRKVLDQLISDESAHQSLAAAAKVCVHAFRSGRKILLVGNGGSAADAQHLAVEFVGRFSGDRPALAAVALTADTSVVTALGNDYGYDRVFARQVSALGAAGDVLIAISTSGRSQSVLRALEEGRAKGLTTVGFSGQRGGDMVALCDHLIRVPSEETAKVQEGHIVLGHILCGIIECELFGSRNKVTDDIDNNPEIRHA